MDPLEPLAAAEWLAVAELDDAGPDARIRLAARLEAGEVEALLADRVMASDEIAWDRRPQAVRAERVTRLGALVLRTSSLAHAEPAAVASALMVGIRAAGIDALPWPEAAALLRARLQFLKQHAPEAWPDLEDNVLLLGLEDRLSLEHPVPRRLADLRAGLLLDLLTAGLDHAQRRRLDAEAPTHVDVPSGSRLPIDYGEEPPVLRVRLQELFGLDRTPPFRGGRTPLTLHLLSPARRPVQVTQDLAGFWARGWPEVRKELRGRYPRHSWPEDPTRATATARARRH
jgi:ATP-dependent helicase HrpB